MKIISKHLFLIITGLLIIVSVLGVFDKQAYEFVSSVSKKNISFLALITEVKLVLASVAGIKIPFISGDTAAINKSLEKTENYLLITNVISYIQLLFLAISKSWIVKGVMILLFFSCFIKKFKPLSSKILILALAISPGLSFYSVVVQNLSEEASISFGSEYLIKLNEKIKAIKVEKSELMQEHAQAINHINNGDKGVVFFKKLKEDVSYDLKKSSVSIKGDYSNIRLLMHKGGHEISKKLFTFGTMILFCLFILPIGYSFLVYVFYKHLFFNAAPSEKMEGVAVNTRTGLEDQPNLFNKLGSAVATAKNDQKMPSNLIKSSVRGVVSKKKKDVEHALAQKIDSTKQIVKDDVSTLANQVVYGENKRDKDIGTKLIQEISLEKHHIEEIENQLHQKLKGKANEMKKDISNDTAKLMGEAKEKKHNLNKPWMNRINMGRIDN